ncbi:MAG: hypothetical protein ACTSYY_03425 [Promethearchaeota archaeon]
MLQNLDDLELETIRTWLTTYISPRTGRKLGPHGQNAYIIELKWFMKRTEIPCLQRVIDPIIQRLRRNSTKSPGRCIDPMIFERLLQFSPSATYDLAFRLIYECGLRPHELLSICVKDISITTISDEKQAVLIDLPDLNPVTPSGKNKTGGRPILVIQNFHLLWEYVQSIKEQNGLESRLFPWAHKTLSVTYSRMKNSCAKADFNQSCQKKQILDS